MKKLWLTTFTVPTLILPSVAISCNIATNNGEIKINYNDDANITKQDKEDTKKSLKTIYWMRNFVLNSITNFSETFKLTINITSDNYVAENKVLNLPRQFLMNFFGYNSIIISDSNQIDSERLNHYKNLNDRTYSEDLNQLEFNSELEAQRQILRKIIKTVIDLNTRFTNSKQ
ncbi:hypothetical protein [Mycoplasma buteonis]|uniref:hypothetical protein n=1 Tax=Mycoplasma buteonis TaxID=171280 RepID=UPI00055E9F56|nr:hypothetical protein [Mycoplasma buteonis]